VAVARLLTLGLCDGDDIRDSVEEREAQRVQARENNKQLFTVPSHAKTAAWTRAGACLGQAPSPPPQARRRRR
jgi:hypothetical protein